MSELSSKFYLIDHAGNKRQPIVINTRDGRTGYAVHPVGKGNDNSAATFTFDEQYVVRQVVVHGHGVRTKADGGPTQGQQNTLGLSGKAIRGYWLAPELRHWVPDAPQPSEELPGETAPDLPDAEQDIANATDLPEDATERKAVIAARRGQGVFRRLLDEHWQSCAVTGCTPRELLRASHIQPWKVSSNADRLNSDNGLLLAAHLDAAFDKGLISFGDDGRILINTVRLPVADAKVIGILPTMQLRAINAEHRPFLAIHRRIHGFVA